MANRKQGGAADGQARAELRVPTPRSWDAVGWRPVGARGTISWVVGHRLRPYGAQCLFMGPIKKRTRSGPLDDQI